MFIGWKLKRERFGVDSRDIKKKIKLVLRFIFRFIEVENKCLDCERGIIRLVFGFRSSLGFVEIWMFSVLIMKFLFW